MVTLDAAAALGAADRLGSLEPGKLADMILIDLGRPHAVPLFDPLTHLVFSCAKSDVRHVFVGGRQVVRDGALTAARHRGDAGRGRGAGAAHRRERRG